ncbi:MAG: hypothetical protein ACYC3W_00545 [Candidatus Nanopelagicales bacterium]
MAKQIDLTVSIPNSTGAIRSQLRHAADLERIALAGGATEATATVEGNVTTLTRFIDVPPAGRTYLKTDQLTITETRVWNQNGADLEITVADLPISVIGSLELTEHGITTILHIVARVEARMGVASPLAEGVIKDRLVAAVNAECEALY